MLQQWHTQKHGQHQLRIARASPRVAVGRHSPRSKCSGIEHMLDATERMRSRNVEIKAESLEPPVPQFRLLHLHHDVSGRWSSD